MIKRDGSRSEVRMDKITQRLKLLCHGLNAAFVDPGEWVSPAGLGG